MSDDATPGTRRSTPDQPSFMRPPRKRLEDYLDFINLDGGIDAFDLTKVKVKAEAEEAEEVEAQEGEIRLWIGRRFRDRGGDTGCERDDEFIYLVRRPGDDEWTKRRRTTKRQDENKFGVLEDQLMFLIPPEKFVLAFLVYSEPGDPGTLTLARELSHRDASLWFMLKEIKLPPPLEPVGLRDPSQDPSSRLNREWNDTSADQLAGSASPPFASREDTPQGKGKPSAPPAVDFADLAAELRKARKPTQGNLVEYMADKREAAVEDVAEHVHADSNTDEKAVRMNANRTNDSLAELDAPLSFRVVSGHVFREISPK